MKSKIFHGAALLLFAAGVTGLAQYGGYKRGYKIGFKDEANGEIKILRITSANGDLRVATSEGFKDVVYPNQVEQLPDELSLKDLLSAWGYGYIGGVGTDPPIFWYLSDREGDFYWVLWEQRDAEALLEGQLDKVRVTSIARSCFDSNRRFDVVWGAEYADVPYIPDGSPFRPSAEEE